MPVYIQLLGSSVLYPCRELINAPYIPKILELLMEYLSFKGNLQTQYAIRARISLGGYLDNQEISAHQKLTHCSSTVCYSNYAYRILPECRTAKVKGDKEGKHYTVLKFLKQGFENKRGIEVMDVYVIQSLDGINRFFTDRSLWGTGWRITEVLSGMSAQEVLPDITGAEVLVTSVVAVVS